MTPIIEVKNLSKKYRIGESQPYITLRDTIAGVFSNPLKSLKDGLRQDEFWALKDINFTVEPGEVVGIIGHNGAGKSTLLKILSRITPPTTGEITLRGRVGSLLEVGTGFQQELTGRENIFLNGAILGMTQAEIKKKFDEIVDFAEVEKFIDTPVKHYSSGMYMRLAFSIAAHLDPEILIVDEVLAVGDAEFQKKCLGKMDEVSKKQGKTVLFVSHNIEAISILCKKSIFLSNGRIEIFDETANVIDIYDKSTNHKLQSRYLLSNSNNHLIKISSISLSDNNDNIRVSDRIVISIFLEILKDTRPIGLTLLFHDKNRVCVFSSMSNLTNYFTTKLSLAGKYKITCEIPPNLLNNQLYFISVYTFDQNYNNLDKYENVLKLLPRDSNKLRHGYNGIFEGVIRPKLQWKVSKI